MTVFKAFLKVVNKCKAPILMYTVILIVFGGLNIKTSEKSMNFVGTKPDIYIINHDEEKGITKSLISYMTNNSNVVNLDNNDDAIKDAIFYRDVNYIIEIPRDYHKDFMKGINPEIKIETTNDYPAMQASTMLNRYLKVAKLYRDLDYNEDELVKKAENVLANETNITMTSELDTTHLSKATFYFNFLNYCLLAGSIYVICLILNSFKNDKIKKRTVISSMPITKFNRDLLLSNGLFALLLWLFYILISFVLVGKVMFTLHGLIYIINSFVFSVCTLSIAFLLGNIVQNKNAINGIINVIALGSSFLCGAFVPIEWLPNAVLKIAHVLPSYWFIQTNEKIATLESINLSTLKPVLINMGVLLIFSAIFIILTNIITHKKQKIN